MRELIERLNRAAKTFGDSQAGNLYAEAAAALEAAREDSGRIKRDIAELYEVMPMLPLTAETMEAATDWFTRYCIDFHSEINAAHDAAIDQSRGKSGGEVEGG